MKNNFCPCTRGFHDECIHKKGCKKCHSEDTPVAVSISAPERKSKVDLKDVHSTGRKRAAVLYPIDKEADCEWQGKKNCGGGRRPIIGCLEGKQIDRHHGPVKLPIRNEEGNVHRICKACHVHWHELNDLIYNEKEYNLLPHNPVEASQTEIALNIVKWQSGEMGREFELASSQNKAKFRERMKEHE